MSEKNRKKSVLFLKVNDIAQDSKNISLDFYDKGFHHEFKIRHN